MILIRLAGAAMALAILAVSTPVGRSDAADNQVTEMPDGLKYTDTKTGDGTTAHSGNKVSVHYTGWLSDNGANGKKFDSSVDRGQPFRGIGQLFRMRQAFRIENAAPRRESPAADADID